MSLGHAVRGKMELKMNSQILSREVEVSCGESVSHGTLSIMVFSSRQRRQRALKTGAICCGVLAVVACIPGAHFVLVPLFVLLSPWLIYRSWSVLSVITEGDLRCARCQGTLTCLTSRERYPIYERCLECQRENRITRVPAPTLSTSP